MDRREKRKQWKMLCRANSVHTREAKNRITSSQVQQAFAGKTNATKNCK